MSTAVSRPLLFALVLSLGFAPLACRAMPEDQVVDGLTINEAALERRAVVDVVLLPIEDATPRQTFADYEDVLRESIGEELVDLRYNAIRNRTLTDDAVRLAGQAGKSVVARETLEALRNRFDGEDAILGIRIGSWELGRIDEDPPTVGFQAELLMIDSATGETLLSGQFDGRIAPSDGVPPTTRRARAAAAASRLGPILLDRLPVRGSVDGLDG